MPTLIVNPRHKVPSKFAAIEPPLWAGLIASYYNCDVLDAEALDLNVDETVAMIEAQKPNEVLLVVMGNNPSVSSTPKMPVAQQIADKLKDRFLVSWAGLHPQATGMTKRKGFDGFPMIPFEKLPMDKYRAHNWHTTLTGLPDQPYASIYTSLGCPFQCYYCNVHALYGGYQWQKRPIEHVWQEVDTLTKKYGVKNIKIWDELFALNEQRVIDICSGLKGYDLNIWAYARVDTITGKMLKHMKQAGISWLAYGFETANADVRKGVNKNYEARVAQRAIEMTRDAGINIMANFMFGLPGESTETARTTLDWAKNQLFEYVNFYEAKPYPGSKWYEETKPDGVWESYDQYVNLKGSVRDKAFREYMTNPAYLEYMGKKFGQQAVKHIDEVVNQWN